jgi:hypothetical protein
MARDPVSDMVARRDINIGEEMWSIVLSFLMTPF